MFHDTEISGRPVFIPLHKLHLTRTPGMKSLRKAWKSRTLSEDRALSEETAG
jgi:hypothetical protein